MSSLDFQANVSSIVPVTVHMSENGDKPTIAPSISTKELKGRVRIKDEKDHGVISGSGNAFQVLDSSESVCSKFSKKSGKPSRKWLALEIDKLFKANMQLNQQLKQRQGREEEQNVTRQRLQSEVAALRAQLESEHIENMRRKNKALSQDVYMLKNLVVKLTAELGKSQERLKGLKKHLETDDCITYSEDSGLDIKYDKKELLEGELGVVWPLVKAYDENLAEKESLISSLKQQMDRIADKAKTVVEENIDLHQRLSSQQTQGEVSYGEYLHQQKELALLLEQNQLLTRQAKLHQSKLQDLRNAFQSNLTEVSVARDSAMEELQQVRTELFMLKGRFSLLQEEHRAAREESESKIPVSVHTASISECKRLLEELKSKYDDERDILMRRLAGLEAGRPDIEGKLVTLASERDRLIGQLDFLEQTTKKLELKCLSTEDKLIRAEKCKETLKNQLTAAVAFSGELIKEQERLVKQLMEKAEEAKIGSGLNKRLHSLKLQVKGVEMEAIEQMSLLDENLRTQVDYVSKIKENYTKEIEKLREDIAKKEEAIHCLAEENKKTQEELDIVWKAATNDNKNSS